MIYSVILVASVLLLIAFAIERFSRVTGVPSVIAMIAVGLLAKPLLNAAGMTLGGIEIVVPIVGTIGLVLIVLDGSLDIELRRDRLKSAAGALIMAGTGFLLCLAIFAPVAVASLGLTLLQASILAVPFAVISSAIAIPGSQFLPVQGREFVVYESSISDILGVLVFFALINSDGSSGGILLGIVGGGALSLLLAAACAVGLALLLMRIDGHIRFIPLLAGLFGLYAVGKLFHLSSLILVLLFGLVINNPTLITRFRPLRNWLDDSYESTLKNFKMLVQELTFAVRGFFFILLGYWTELSDIASFRAWLAAVFILLVVYGVRYAMFRVGRHPLANALTWVAPRGLITVLLFLSAQQVMPLPHFLGGTVMLVVLASAALIAVARLRIVGKETENRSGSA